MSKAIRRALGASLSLPTALEFFSASSEAISPAEYGMLKSMNDIA